MAMVAGNSSPLPNPNPNPSAPKRKRNLPGTPDPEAEVVALSPKTLLTATTFVCDVCGKEFRRDQNLQIHRRGHNLPWKFPSKSSSASAAGGGGKEQQKKRVYVCPAEGCVYHEASRALGDLTGIKKHYSRKHGDKKWECDRCLKKYAVMTDWKAHRRVCGARQYECASCGTLFARKDSFTVHRASCDAASAGAEGEGEEEEATKVVMRAGTVNTELLFPSLWGQASAAVREENEGRG